MVRKLFEAGTNFYEEQPFYSLERVSKPRENEFGTCYLVKLAVVGAVWLCKLVVHENMPYK